jgi:cell wall assembly regulator SMI1
MKKILTTLALAALATGAAQAAGTYAALQQSDCKLVSAGELSQAVQKASTDAGLNLPKDMAIRAELHCTQDAGSKRFVYTIRAAIEKMVNDGEAQRWTSLADLTGYGTTAGSAALLRQVQFTVRDVIRQEP